MTFRTIAAARAEELGAVLHLPLDDESGATARATIGSDGTYSGGPTLEVAGPSDYLPAGISTDGVDDRVVLPSVAWTAWENPPFTYEVWFQTPSGDPSSAEWLVWIGWSASTNSMFGFSFHPSWTDKIAVVMRDDGGTIHIANVPSVTTVRDGAWHHLAYTEDASRNGVLYIDGEAEATTGPYTPGTMTLDRGRLCRREGNTVDGEMDGETVAFTIYDRALTAAEVYENYRLGLDLAVGTALSPVSY